MLIWVLVVLWSGFHPAASSHQNHLFFSIREVQGYVAEDRNTMFREALRQHMEFSQIPDLYSLIPSWSLLFRSLLQHWNKLKMEHLKDGPCVAFPSKKTQNCNREMAKMEGCSGKQKEESLQKKKTDDTWISPGSKTGLSLSEKILGTCYLE